MYVFLVNASPSKQLEVKGHMMQRIRGNVSCDLNTKVKVNC